MEVRQIVERKKTILIGFDRYIQASVIYPLSDFFLLLVVSILVCFI